MRGRRRTTASPSVTSVIEDLPPGGMEINGALLAGDRARGGRTISGVTVVFSPTGILVESPEMTTSSLFSWDNLDSVRCSETTVLPDGRSASVLELLSNGQTVRFLLPADSVSPGQVAYLEQAVPEWLNRYRTVPRSSAATWPVEDAGAATAVLPVVAWPNGHGVAQPLVESYQPTIPPPPISAHWSGPNGSAIPPPPVYDPPPTPNGLASRPPSYEPAPADDVGSEPNRHAESDPPNAGSPAVSYRPTVPPPPPSEAPAPSYWPTVLPPSESPQLVAPTPTLRPPTIRPPTIQPPPIRPPSIQERSQSYRPTVPPPPSSEPAPEPTPPPAPPPAPEPWSLTVSGPAGHSSDPDPDPAALVSPPGLFSDLLAVAGPAASPTFDPAEQDVQPVGATIVNPWLGLADPPVADRHAEIWNESGKRRRRTARPKDRTGPVRVIVILLIVLVVAAGAFVLLRGHGGGVTPEERSQGTVLAASINLRLPDLPAGWNRSGATATVAPAAPVARLESAVRTLAACVDQPVDTVSGWFGTAPFPGQTASVRSLTFAELTDPALQMFSTTTVLLSPSDVQPLETVVASPKFATCLGRYQVATVTIPATAQVQTVPLTAPAGVKAYGYVTTLTFPGQRTAVVGDAFLLGTRTVTLLSPSTNGPAIPRAVFDQAYNAIVARVAGDSG